MYVFKRTPHSILVQHITTKERNAVYVNARRSYAHTSNHAYTHTILYARFKVGRSHTLRIVLERERRAVHIRTHTYIFIRAQHITIKERNAEHMHTLQITHTILQLHRTSICVFVSVCKIYLEHQQAGMYNTTVSVYSRLKAAILYTTIMNVSF